MRLRKTLVFSAYNPSDNHSGTFCFCFGAGSAFVGALHLVKSTLLQNLLMYHRKLLLTCPNDNAENTSGWFLHDVLLAREGRGGGYCMRGVFLALAECFSRNAKKHSGVFFAGESSQECTPARSDQDNLSPVLTVRLPLGAVDFSPKIYVALIPIFRIQWLPGIFIWHTNSVSAQHV